MNARTAVRLLIAQTALMILLAWGALYLGRDEFKLFAQKEAEEVPTASHVEQDGGAPSVKLTRAAQTALGIELAAPQATELAAADAVSAQVVDTQPLAEMRARLAAAKDEVTAARATAAASAAERKRAQALFADDRNISERALQTATAQAAADAARVRAAEAAQDALRAGARGTWGRTLVDGIEAGDAKTLRLLNGEDALLRVAVRAEALRGAHGRLRIALPGNEAARSAQFVAVAPQADAQHGGAGLFYRASREGLTPGMRLAARLERGTDARDGALVPASAVVWHAGKAWVYVLEGTEEFQRREIPTGEPVGDAWFVPAFEEDDRVVTRGAQVLLSEEQKYQIKNENDD